MLNFKLFLDRNSCRFDDMGASRLFLYDEKLNTDTPEQAAMAYIVRTLVMTFTPRNCVHNF